MTKNTLLFSAFLLCLLTSCLKDEHIENMKYGMKGVGDKPLVEFPYTSSQITTVLNSSTSDTSFALVRVRLNEGEPASEDVRVTLVPNNALVTDAGYTVAPTSAYTLDNLVVTIPAGSREGVLSITTKTANLASATHAFGFTISAVSSSKYAISENFRNILAVLPIRNKYDGTYTANGYFYHPTSPRAINNRSKTLSTAGSNSIIVELGNLGGSGYQALITVDESTNELQIQAAPGAAGSPYTMFTTGLPTTEPGYTAGWTGSAASTNRYDPATKTFYVRYGYMGAGGWRVTEEHITKN